jgi:hypothetical protein
MEPGESEDNVVVVKALKGNHVWLDSDTSFLTPGSGCVAIRARYARPVTPKQRTNNDWCIVVPKTTSISV